jgi:hypothetical protein
MSSVHESRRMRHVRHAVLDGLFRLTASAAPLHAQITVHTTFASWLAAVTGAGLDTFDDLDPDDGFLDTPAPRTAGAFSYVASAPEGMFPSGTPADPFLVSSFSPTKTGSWACRVTSWSRCGAVRYRDRDTDRRHDAALSRLHRRRRDHVTGNPGGGRANERHLCHREQLPAGRRAEQLRAGTLERGAAARGRERVGWRGASPGGSPPRGVAG